MFAAICEEFTREVNRLRIGRDAKIIEHRTPLERIEWDLEKAIQAVLDGVPGAMLMDNIRALEGRKTELTAFATPSA